MPTTELKEKDKIKAPKEPFQNIRFKYCFGQQGNAFKRRVLLFQLRFTFLEKRLECFQQIRRHHI